MLRPAFVVVCATLAVACSSPPDKERHQAEGAIAAARAADAATYAPDVLQTAETALAGYDAAVAQRDFREALRLALEARDSAFMAAREASDEKAAVRSRAEQLVAELATLLTPVEAPTPVRSSGTRVTPDASADVAATSTLLQDARSKLVQGDYRSIERLLMPEIARLRAATASAEPAAPAGAR